MIKGTFWLAERDNGGITIGIEDYEVEMFAGGDYEWSYTLDCDNKEKLVEILQLTQHGTLEEMIAAEFGIHLDKKPSMKQWLDNNGIKYEFFAYMT